jgi:hypothetical protein
VLLLPYNENSVVRPSIDQWLQSISRIGIPSSLLRHSFESFYDYTTCCLVSPPPRQRLHYSLLMWTTNNLQMMIDEVDYLKESDISMIAPSSTHTDEIVVQFSMDDDTVAQSVEMTYDTDNCDNVCLPRDLMHLVGTTLYYGERAKDFLMRNPNSPVPYYLEYGEKYQNRFMNMRSRFSVESQTWVDRTHRGLQEVIELKRQSDPSAFGELEKDGTAFRHFCFKTHGDVYMESGFGYLSFSETWIVITTPDLQDFFIVDAVVEGLHVVRQCLPIWSHRLVSGCLCR